MRPLDLLSLILDNLGRRKARVALTAIGVVIGTAAVVVLVSLGIGLQQSATENLFGITDLTQIFVYPKQDLGPGPGVVFDGSAIGGGGGGGGGATSTEGQLTTKALEAITALAHVRAVIAQEYIQAGNFLKFGRLEGYVNIIGVSTDNLAELGLTAQVGELVLTKGVAVIGPQVPLNFYDPKLRPGQAPPAAPELVDKQVQLVVSKFSQEGLETRKNIPLRIAGMVTQTGGQSDWTVYLPMDEVEAINRWATGKRVDRTRTGYQQVIVKADDPANVLPLAEEIKTLGFNADSPQQFLQPINNFFTILQLIFGGVGAIALLVAAIGIANTMTMAILERTREIGLMKAVGASNQDVLTVFLGEAAGIGFLGGLGGVGLGWSAGQVVNVVVQAYMASQPTQPGIIGGGATVAAITPIWLLVGSLVFSTLVGIISGLYPALRAATLVPVLALKYE